MGRPAKGQLEDVIQLRRAQRPGRWVLDDDGFGMGLDDCSA